MAVEQTVTGGVAVATLRRDFQMPEIDQDFLDANYPSWETLQDGSMPWLILNSFPVPPGYNHTTVRAAIQIPSGYPNAALDMVYFFPDLVRASGRPIAALAPQPIAGQNWQRWSRHYSWRAGVDELATHIERIKSWLEAELTR
jgi:hypothetical protein